MDLVSILGGLALLGSVILGLQGVDKLTGGELYLASVSHLAEETTQSLPPAQPAQSSQSAMPPISGGSGGSTQPTSQPSATQSSTMPQQTSPSSQFTMPPPTGGSSPSGGSFQPSSMDQHMDQQFNSQSRPSDQGQQQMMGGQQNRSTNTTSQNQGGFFSNFFGGGNQPQSQDTKSQMQNMMSQQSQGGQGQFNSQQRSGFMGGQQQNQNQNSMMMGGQQNGGSQQQSSANKQQSSGFFQGVKGLFGGSSNSQTGQQQNQKSMMGGQQQSASQESDQSQEQSSVNPQEVKQASAQAKQMLVQVKRALAQLKKVTSTGKDVEALTKDVDELTKIQSDLGDSDDSTISDAIDNLRNADYMQDIQSVNFKLQLPRQVKQFNQTLKILNNVLQTKAVRSLGLDIDKAQTAATEMKSSLDKAQADVQSGDLDSAMEITQSFQNGDNPNDIQSTIFKVRDIKNMEKRVKDTQVRAEVDKLLEGVTTAFNQGNYQDARSTLDEYADDIQRLISQFIQQGSTGSGASSKIQNLESLIQSKLQQESQNNSAVETAPAR